MKVWSRLMMVFSIAASPRVERAVIKEQTQTPPLSEVDMARRWQTARKGQPELAADVIRLGKILVLQPINVGEVDQPNKEQKPISAMPLDGITLAYEAGRRDFAMQILAMMNLTIDDFNLMTERDDDH